LRQESGNIPAAQHFSARPAFKDSFLVLDIRVVLFVLSPEYYLVAPQVQLYWYVAVFYA
jgi:hypothetical protein